MGRNREIDFTEAADELLREKMMGEVIFTKGVGVKRITRRVAPGNLSEMEGIMGVVDETLVREGEFRAASLEIVRVREGEVVGQSLGEDSTLRIEGA